MRGEQFPDSCPYGDKECPKLVDIKRDIDEVRDSVKDLARILYVIAGILTVQLGVTII